MKAGHRVMGFKAGGEEALGRAIDFFVVHSGLQSSSNWSTAVPDLNCINAAVASLRER
jgi:hypothetical protein